MTRPASLEHHPDLIEMRERYERAGSSSVAQAIEGLGLLAGLYLAISPWVVGFNGLSRLSVSNLVTGIVVAALALAFASAYGRTYGVSWVAPVIGIWTIIAPWITGSATRGSIWNNVVTGIVILLLGLGAVAMGTKKMAGMSHKGNTSHRGDTSHRTDMPGRADMPNRPDFPNRP
ncbi:SPW repeat protein [Streptosporangium sp. NPDC006930]|uniref:SPW repeat protein n=1 Tax=unclassified Streptosporangium TaxID=2632669 RepID=UPI00342F780A